MIGCSLSPSFAGVLSVYMLVIVAFVVEFIGSLLWLGRSNDGVVWCFVIFQSCNVALTVFSAMMACTMYHCHASGFVKFGVHPTIMTVIVTVPSIVGYILIFMFHHVDKYECMVYYLVGTLTQLASLICRFGVVYENDNTWYWIYYPIFTGGCFDSNQDRGEINFENIDYARPPPQEKRHQEISNPSS